MTAYPCENYYAQLNEYNQRDGTDREIAKRDKRIEKLESALALAQCLIATNRINAPQTMEVIKNALENEE